MPRNRRRHAAPLVPDPTVVGHRSPLLRRLPGWQSGKSIGLIESFVASQTSPRLWPPPCIGRAVAGRLTTGHFIAGDDRSVTAMVTSKSPRFCLLKQSLLDSQPPAVGNGCERIFWNNRFRRTYRHNSSPGFGYSARSVWENFVGHEKSTAIGRHETRAESSLRSTPGR